MSRRRAKFREQPDTHTAASKPGSGKSGKPGTGPTRVDATSEGAEALRRLEELRSRITERVAAEEPDEPTGSEPADNGIDVDVEPADQAPDPPAITPVMRVSKPSLPNSPASEPVTRSSTLRRAQPVRDSWRSRRLTMPEEWAVEPPSVEDFLTIIKNIRDSATLRTLLNRPPQGGGISRAPAGWQGVPAPLTDIFKPGINPVGSIPVGGPLTEESLRMWWTLVLWRAAAIRNYWSAWCQHGSRPEWPFNGYEILPTSQPSTAISAYRMGAQCWILTRPQETGLRYSATSLLACIHRWELAHEDYPALVRLK